MTAISPGAMSEAFDVLRAFGDEQADRGKTELGEYVRQRFADVYAGKLDPARGERHRRFCASLGVTPKTSEQFARELSEALRPCASWPREDVAPYAAFVGLAVGLLAKDLSEPG